MNRIPAIVGGTLVSMFSTSAAFAQFVVEPPKCETSSGTVFVEQGANLEAFKKAGATDPAEFVSAMIKASNCYTVTTDAQNADFIISVGVLSKKQFNRGAASFASQPIMSGTTTSVDSPLAALTAINKTVQDGNALPELLDAISSGKMRYGYIQLTKNRTGVLLGRGFGRNNQSSLDYTTWNVSAYDAQAVQFFNTEKKARLVGGSLVNAYFDLQKSVDYLGPAKKLFTTP